MTARPSAGCAWTYKTMPANRSPKPSRWSAWRHQSLPLRASSLTSPGQGVIDDAPLERQAQAGSSKPSSFPEHGIHDLPRSRPQVALR